MRQEVLSIQSLNVAVATEKGQSPIVRDVSLQLYTHETLALVGESGSGKTTLAHALVALHSKKSGFETKGKVVFSGEDLFDLSEKRLQEVRGAKISIIFQNPSSALNPVFSIGSQVAEVFRLHGDFSDEDIEKKTFDVLKEVGLGDLPNPFEVYPHQLSGGMKQRVMIAMAIAMGPKVLIADEPTSALDVTVQKEILDLLRKYRKNHAMAFLLITHDLGVVREMADRVAVMYLGEIVEIATADELFTNPCHPYTRALLASLLTKDNRKKMLTTNPIGESRDCPYGKTKLGEFFSISATHQVRPWNCEIGK